MGVLPRSAAKEYSPATSYGNRGLRDTDVLPRSTSQQIRLASHSCRRWCSGRDLLDTDVLPGSAPQKLRVRTGCTPQSSSTW